MLLFVEFVVLLADVRGNKLLGAHFLYEILESSLVKTLIEIYGIGATVAGIKIETENDVITIVTVVIDVKRDEAVTMVIAKTSFRSSAYDKS